MTKMLALGMPLPEIVRAVTDTPRAIMGVDRPWLAENGTVRHATLFRVVDQRIVTVAIVVDGRRFEVTS